MFNYEDDLNSVKQMLAEVGHVVASIAGKKTMLITLSVMPGQ
jgi:hypothetical protein